MVLFIPCGHLTLEGCGGRTSTGPGGYSGHLQAKIQGFVKINKTQVGQEFMNKTKRKHKFLFVS